MKKFIKKLLLFGIIITAVILVILSKYGGFVDYFYAKFTCPKQHSLIIGDSRSFQGILPAIINENLKNHFELPMLNYSFTLKQVAYGDYLLKSIKSKTDENTKNGLFILSVEPWILAERDTDDFANGKYFEQNVPPNNMNFTSMNPNIEYFFKNYNYFHFKAVFRQISQVHADGWLEESNVSTDTVVLNSWKQTQKTLYSGFVNKWKKSPYRLSKLEQTVVFLKKHGLVVLVRMPSSKHLEVLEEKLWNNFDQDMKILSSKNNVSYINYSKIKTNYRSYDGVHLDKKSSAIFTKSLCDSIKLIKYIKN